VVPDESGICMNLYRAKVLGLFQSKSTEVDFCKVKFEVRMLAYNWISCKFIFKIKTLELS